MFIKLFFEAEWVIVLTLGVYLKSDRIRYAAAFAKDISPADCRSDVIMRLLNGDTNLEIHIEECTVQQCHTYRRPNILLYIVDC